MGRTPFAAMLAALLLANPAAAQAQFSVSGDQPASAADSVRLQRFLERWSGSVALGVMQPTGEFGQNVANGVGVDAEAAFRVDRRGILSLRALANFTGYGHEVRRSLLSSSIGGRILVDVVTDNEIFSFGIGPRIQAPSGPLRPYLAGSAGFANFTTGSHIREEDSYDDESRQYFSTEHLSSTRFDWTGSAGLLIPVRWARGSSMQVDLGATFHGGGRARYLREDDITDNPDGSISFDPRHTDTDFLVYRLGVRFGF